MSWIHQYESGQNHSNFEFPVEDVPCSWFAPAAAGTIVIVNVGGTSLTYNAVGGEVVRGEFTSLTSTTCRVLMGNTDPPSPALATAGTSTASSLDTRASTAESVSTSIVTRTSAAESVSTSIVTRFSTSVSTLTSTDTSVVTRFSTSVSTLTSADTSLTTRISIAESVEASKG